MKPNKHVYVVPRWGGSSCSDWYPWLKQQLEKTALEDDCRYVVEPLDMPAWEVPTIEQAKSYLTETLPAERLATEETYLVGHSVGCLAILHHLAEVAQQRPEVRIGGVLCVAGWFIIDNPWQDIRKWMDAPIDYVSARRVIPEDKLIVLISDDDPYTTGYQLNQRLWLERLNARVHLLPGRQHFSDQLQMDVRDAVRDLSGAFNQPAVFAR